MPSRKTVKTLGLRGALSVLMVVAGVSAAGAETVVFPGSSAFGIVPPEGFEKVEGYAEFVSPARNASIAFFPLPYIGQDDDLTLNTAEALVANGMVEESRRSVVSDTLKGLLILAHQVVDGVPTTMCVMAAHGIDVAVLVQLQIPTEYAETLGPDPCAALLTVVERPQPAASSLDRLSFELTELGQMRVDDTPSEGGARLVLGPGTSVLPSERPHLVIFKLEEQKPQSMSLEDFSRDIASMIPVVRELRIISERPLDIDGAPAFEIVGKGLESTTGVPLAVVQWIRLAPDGSSIILAGTVRAADRESAFAEFRKVRDGLRVK